MNFLKKIYNKGITHGGIFHADDVLSTCLLILCNPKFTCERVSSVPDDYTEIVYDIGGGIYDHHADIKKRGNGKSYAAFGLLWKDYGSLFMSKEQAELFDDVFVSEIDRCDTSSNTNLLTSSIEYFNPPWYEDGEAKSDAAFAEAVNTFTPLLKRLIDHFKRSTFIPRFCKTMNEDIMNVFEIMNQKQTGRKNEIQYNNPHNAWNLYYKKTLIGDDDQILERSFISQINKTYGKYKTSPFVLAITLLSTNERLKIFEKILEKRINRIQAIVPAQAECERVYKESKRKELLVFEKYVPTDSISKNHEDVICVIYPSGRGGYCILPIEMNEKEKLEKAKNPKEESKRIYFPEKLRGKEEEDLNDFSKGLSFVHTTGFLATCDSLEHAILFFNKIRSLK